MSRTQTQEDANKSANHHETQAAAHTNHRRQNDDAPAHENRDNQDFDNANRSENLRDSPLMARLLDALEAGTDIGHYGQFTFVAVARHFMEEDEIVSLLSKQPDMGEEKARALYIQVRDHDYNPPRRERILEQQAHQEFQIIPDPNDPDMGNLYRELRFPDGLYEHINHYYEDKAESEK